MSGKEPERVAGIIMVLTCKKYLETRVKELNLNSAEHELNSGWKTVFVYGDLSLEEEYKLEYDFNPTQYYTEEEFASIGSHLFLKIRCEDSYFHLFKKMTLAFKYLNEVYDIAEGILRLGDDVVLNNTTLSEFLEISKKPHYMGSNKFKTNYMPTNSDIFKRTVDDNFMVDYYKNNSADLENPDHNLAGIDFTKYIKHPYIPYLAGGVIVYYSKYASTILYKWMEYIQYDILHLDEFSNSYPYIIEDIAVAYILYRNYIPLYYYPMYADSLNEYKTLPDCIGIHTNKYKL